MTTPLKDVLDILTYAMRLEEDLGQDRPETIHEAMLRVCGTHWNAPTFRRLVENTKRREWE